MGTFDADAEGVGAADHRQESALRELFDEPSVLRQHPRVVDADARADELRESSARTRR